MTPTNVGSTRPTDAEVLDTLRTAAFALDIAADDLDSDDIVNPKATRNIKVWAGRLMELGNNIADALEAAGVEPSPLAHITTIGQLFEVIDWDFDGNGLTVTLRGRDTRDLRLLANAIAITFPALKNDMPHLMTTNDDARYLHRPDCSPDCSTHHRMTNEAPYNDEPYTVSGVDYTFTEGC